MFYIASAKTIKTLTHTCEASSFLARRASSWATLLCCLFTCLIFQLVKQFSNERMPWYRLSRLPSVNLSFMLLTVDSTSNSIITWRIFISQESKIPFSTAIACTLATKNWPWKYLQLAAMTAPHESLMITLMLEFLPSLEVAPSTLTLKIPGDGGVQPPFCAVVPVFTATQAFLCSWRNLLAKLQIGLGNWHIDSNAIRFLLYQIDQATPKNNSKSRVVHFSRIFKAASKMSYSPYKFSTIWTSQKSQTLLATL